MKETKNNIRTGWMRAYLGIFEKSTMSAATLKIRYFATNPCSLYLLYSRFLHILSVFVPTKINPNKILATTSEKIGENEDELFHRVR